MNVSELSHQAEVLYGPRWQTDLARGLGVSARLVRYWASGQRPVPGWVPEALADVSRGKLAEWQRMAEGGR